jgi:hypothetical protein
VSAAQPLAGADPASSARQYEGVLAGPLSSKPLGIEVQRGLLVPPGSEGDKKTERPPGLGLAVVADLWLWGALSVWAPTYLQISSGWRFLFYVFGFVFLIVSFAGALLEIGKLWSKEGLDYWGVSLVFLLPAAVLYLLSATGRIEGVLLTIAKVAFLLLLAVGGPMFLQGVPYFIRSSDRKREPKPAEEHNLHRIREDKAAQRKTTLEIVGRILVAFLSLATAIVALVEKLLS